MYLDKGILGCRYGSSQPQRDVRRYVDLYRQGRLKLHAVKARVVPSELRKVFAVHGVDDGILNVGLRARMQDPLRSALLIAGPV